MFAALPNKKNMNLVDSFFLLYLIVCPIPLAL